MNIAVASNTTDEDAQVYTHAARAPFYLLYDDNGTLLDAIANPFVSIERGAAPRVVRLLQEHGVNTIVAGEFGDRFVALLEENNIEAVTSSGAVIPIIEDITA